MRFEIALSRHSFPIYNAPSSQKSQKSQEEKVYLSEAESDKKSHDENTLYATKSIESRNDVVAYSLMYK